MTGRPPVVVFDAHRQGFKHSLVNAALAHAAELGFREQPVNFLADPGHRRWVLEALDLGPPGAGRRIDWRELPGSRLPGWGLVGRWGRGRVARDMTAYALAALQARRADLLLVTSVTSLGVAMLGRVARLCPRTPILAVLHGVNDVLAAGGESRSREGRRLLAALRRPQPRNLRFLTTTRLISDSLGELHADLAPLFVAFDLPYFWRRDLPPPPPEPGAPLRFGFFGIARADSFAAFEGLATRVKADRPEAGFILVGYLREDPSHASEDGAVDGVGHAPLSLAELRRRADRVHYALWTRPSAEYRLRLSASLLDAFSQVVPVVAIRSPFVEHCFRTMGDIGYLCDDESEVESVIRELIRSPPLERYRAQCETILRERRRFDPATAGAALARHARALAAGERAHGETG